MYALPVTLRYKGEKSFYTNFGALTSCIVMLVMLSFTMTYVKEMLDDKRVVSSYTEKLSYLKPESQQCTSSTDCPYLFGFKMINSTTGEDYLIDPNYF